MRRTPIRAGATLIAATLMLAAPVWAQQAPPKQVPPVPFGERFPAATFKNLNPGGVETVDLAAVLGKKPVVLCYWIAGNPRADQFLMDVQAAVEEAGVDKVALYGVAYQRPGREAAQISPYLSNLGVKVPVLDDEGFVLGQQLRVQTVPNLTIIDADGILKVTNGASLSQALEYNMDLRAALERAARTGNVGPYGFLPRYHPVKELVGKSCPDFKAPLMSDGAEYRFHNLIDDSKLNVLIFWSVDCPHCRKSLPELNTWLKKNHEDVNIVSAANVNSEETEVKTKEFCETNDFVFRVMYDRDSEISRLYKVTTTPTFVVIGPDGVVDSVLLSGLQDIGKALEQKKRQLLKSEDS
jgi:peroxiredoxin